MPEEQQLGGAVDLGNQKSFTAFDLPEIAGIQVLSLLNNQSAESDVWLAQQTDGKEVALKIYRHGRIPGLMDDQKKRSLQHPNLLPVLRTGEMSGRYYEILPYVTAPTLAQVFLTKRTLSESEAVALVRQLAEAIHYLHAEQVLHRDIKPSNVFVSKDEPFELMLADFGTARLTAYQTMLTGSVGTVAYSSPEALTGLQSEASDYWSLGIMVMEALTGRQPFAGIDLKQQLYRVVSGKIEIPEGIAPHWKELLQGLLTSDYTQRWRKKEIDAWLGAEVKSAPPKIFSPPNSVPASTPLPTVQPSENPMRLRRLPERGQLTVEDFFQIFMDSFNQYFWRYFWILFILPGVTRNSPIGWDLVFGIILLAIASRYTPAQLERYKRRKRVEWNLRGYPVKKREEIKAAVDALFGREHDEDGKDRNRRWRKGRPRKRRVG